MNSNRAKLIQSLLLVILFSVIITSHLWVEILQIKDVTKSENRDLAEMPTVKLDQSLLKFPAEYENYYSDHFPLRYWLIQTSRQVRYHLFNEHVFPLIVIGDGGYLHLHNNRYFDICQKIPTLKQKDLERYTQRLNASQQLLDSEGIEFFIAIIPEKCTIYPETSENYIPILGQQSSTDQLFEYLSANSTIPMINLADSLNPLKDEEKTFYRTDSHWTPIGAYAAYKQIITSLNPEMSPDELIEWDYENNIMESDEGILNLARMLSIPAFYSEKWLNPEIFLLDYTTTEDNADIYSPPDAPIDKTILVFHDSYLLYDPIRSFLAQHYQKSIFLSVNDQYFWSNNTDELRNIIDKWEPDIVLIVYVERNTIRLKSASRIYYP